MSDTSKVNSPDSLSCLTRTPECVEIE